jgi:hypothetical protein
MIDRYTLAHLDRWLDEQIEGDTNRADKRARMVTLIEEDEEYWGSQSWWNVYDHAIREIR